MLGISALSTLLPWCHRMLATIKAIINSMYLTKTQTMQIYMYLSIQCSQEGYSCLHTTFTPQQAIQHTERKSTSFASLMLKGFDAVWPEGYFVKVYNKEYLCRSDI